MPGAWRTSNPLTPTTRAPIRLAVPCLALLLLGAAAAPAPRSALAGEAGEKAWSVLDSGTVVDSKGRRQGEIRERAGRYDIYAPDGRRLGYGRPSSLDPNRIEFFAPDGKRLFDVKIHGQPGKR